MQNLKEYAFSKYDALIYTEDDNEFSPCFLQFVNGALDAYRDEKKVLSVCGYTPESFYGISKGKQLFVSDTCAWGMGIWRAKEQFVSSVPPIYYRNILRSPWKSLMLFIHYPMLLNMLMDMVLGNLSYGDVKRTAYCILNHYYQVRPLVSMVRNWGFDGSGVNCNKVKGEKMSTQQIEEGSYTFAFQRPRKTRGLKKALFFHGTEADRHVAYKQIRRTFKRYLKGWWHRSF